MSTLSSFYFILIMVILLDFKYNIRQADSLDRGSFILQLWNKKTLSQVLLFGLQTARNHMRIKDVTNILDKPAFASYTELFTQ